MAPQEEFWNLQSKHRGKKTFNFYDKMVPQPFKVTPSPSITPSITPTPSITQSVTPTPSISISPTPSISISPTPSITLTPTPTSSIAPNDSPNELDQYFTSPGTYPYGCFSLSGHGYVRYDSVEGKYQYVEGTHPDGNNYSFYVKDDDPNKTVVCYFNDSFFNPNSYRWATSLFSLKTSTGWTDGEFINTTGSRTFGYTDNTSTNGYHYPGRTVDFDYDCANISPTPTPTNTITPTITPSITPSISISPTPSISISQTPSISITPSISQSVSPTVTPTISLTPSISVTPNLSVTPTITPTNSITPTPTNSITPTPTPSNYHYNVFEFTIDTTKQNNNSSNTDEFEFSRTGWSFISPDPSTITIYWGDGNSDNPYTTRNHTYSSPGVYTIRVESGSVNFYDKIGVEFAWTATDYYEGDACKVISVSRIPSYTTIPNNTFEACRNLTGFTGLAQYSSLSGNTQASFRNCTSLISGLSNFDVSQVTDMTNLFQNCISYNEDLSSWDMSNVSDISAMFYSATSWNQNVGSWDIGNILGAVNTFANTNLQTSNYDQILIGWASQSPNIKNNVILFGVPCGYTSAASSARSVLTSTHSWTINDGGLVP